MIQLRSYESTRRTDEIEMPDMVDLINSPFYHSADLNDIYKYGGETLRYLINKLKLNNNTKYVSVQLNVQYLNQNVISVPRGTWHQDVEDDKFTTHLLINECTAMTEFLAKDLILENMYPEDADSYKLEAYLSKHQDTFESVVCEPNRFITFTDQFHKAVNATKPEFRFMMRVIESDRYVTKPYHRAVLDRSIVFKDGFNYKTITAEDVYNYDQIGFGSIIKNKDTFVIRKNENV